MCGAVSGGVMGIGLAEGRIAPDDSVETTYRMVQEFMREFESRFGSLNCCELVGVDTRTDEGRSYARQHGLYARCRTFSIEAAGMILEKL